MLGILGGLGPAATADFMHRLVKSTPAKSDQDHITTVVYSDPSTPDRSQAILRGGATPLPSLLKGIDFLNSVGVSVIALPCNTAHFWFEELQSASRVPIINMPRAVMTTVRKEEPALKRIGLLSTDATAIAGTYKRFGESNIDLVDLTDLGEQDPVMAGIRNVKAGNIDEAIDQFHQGVELMKARGVEGLIYGCTEVSVALQVRTEVFGLPAWDSSDCLATEAVSIIKSQSKN